jgi:hypothetical protein
LADTIQEGVSVDVSHRNPTENASNDCKLPDMHVSSTRCDISIVDLSITCGAFVELFQGCEMPRVLKEVVISKFATERLADFTLRRYPSTRQQGNLQNHQLGVERWRRKA